ncbi:O-methyltransferase, family 3 [hydrothermal vent metagenome]|uniref:O-methyltransferase, family 3 n=1 Tax=hydrothermal vent metagenome TaxID=652676 RepID=A0A3B0YWM9_9ZZZZ
MEKGHLDFDDDIHAYVLTHSLRESDLLAKLREETEKDAASIMQIPPEQGQFMSMLVKLIGAKRSIEIGVYTGYSALCVAQAMPDDSYTVACDVDEHWTEVATRYWAEASVDHKIDLRLAPAVDTLNALINDGQGESFDFVFIDADKDNYDSYYELSLRLLRPGGLIAIDNVLLFGAVVDKNNLKESQKNIFSDESIQSVRALNRKIKDDERVDISMLKMADGLTLVRKK